MIDNGEKTILTVPLVERGSARRAARLLRDGARARTSPRRSARSRGRWASRRRSPCATRSSCAGSKSRTGASTRCSSRRRRSPRASTSTRCSRPSRARPREALDCQQCQIQEFDADGQHGDRGGHCTARIRDPLAYESLHQTFSLDDEPEERAIIVGKAPGRAVRLGPGRDPGRRGLLREVRRQGVPERAAGVQRRPVRPARPDRDGARAPFTPEETRARAGAGRAGRRRHRARAPVPLERAAGDHRRPHGPLQPPLLLRAARPGGRTGPRVTTRRCRCS